MSETPEHVWLSQRRLYMAMWAALIIALPLIWTPIVFGVVALLFWMLIWFAALMSIVLVQLPLKIILAIRGWPALAVGASVCGANVVVALVVFSTLTPFRFSFEGVFVCCALAIIAAAVWTGLDDKALYGSERYSQGSYDA